MLQKWVDEATELRNVILHHAYIAGMVSIVNDLADYAVIAEYAVRAYDFAMEGFPTEHLKSRPAPDFPWFSPIKVTTPVGSI